MDKSDNKGGLNVPVWMTFGNSLRITNIVLLKFAWAACVIGGTFYGGIVLAGMFLTCHLQRRWRKEYPFFIVLGLVGTMLDALWIYAGILDYGADTLSFGPLQLAPLWITFLWVGLGLSIFEVLSFFVSRPTLAATLFAASAPFSYLAGAQFDAVLINSNMGLLAISGSWLVSRGPTLRYLANARLDDSNTVTIPFEPAPVVSAAESKLIALTC